MPENIAITGLGSISACGNNTEETLESFSSGKRSAGPVSLFKTELKYPVFEVKNFFNKDISVMRTLNLAFQALAEAVSDASLEDLSGYRVGICLGTTVASQLNDIDFYKTYREKGSAPLERAKRFLNSNLAQAVVDFLKIKTKFCCTVVNACSSGTDAIGLGLSWLRNDYCDIVIAGGADELNRVPFDGFVSLGVVSNSLSLPFDRERSGLNLGEGAGIVILEKESIALRRGRKPDLFLKGYGLAADGYHLTAPHPEGKGLEKALKIALSEAGINVGGVAFVNAHGTATKDNDKVEGVVLKKVFGPKLKFLSTKGFTGHTLGAAGGLEAVFSALALRQGWIPASSGFINQDDEIGISPVQQKTEIKGSHAVSTSLAFGGNNSALVISRN
jgi:3-oxoacyl-(acyl-carrier-protein) synthase